jgi:hypothetical protein
VFLLDEADCARIFRHVPDFTRAPATAAGSPAPPPAER